MDYHKIVLVGNFLKVKTSDPTESRSRKGKISARENLWLHYGILLAQMKVIITVTSDSTHECALNRKR